MRYRKSTGYALHAAMEMALSQKPVTVAELHERFGIPEGALAKVMQSLVRAGIARGLRGVGGGYLLARPPAEVTVLDVIQVFEESHRPNDLFGESEPRPSDGPSGRLRRLFEEVQEIASCTFASVNLEVLTRERAEVQQAP